MWCYVRLLCSVPRPASDVPLDAYQVAHKFVVETQNVKELFSWPQLNFKFGRVLSSMRGSNADQNWRLFTVKSLARKIRFSARDFLTCHFCDSGPWPFCLDLGELFYELLQRWGERDLEFESTPLTQHLLAHSHTLTHAHSHAPSLTHSHLHNSRRLLNLLTQI